MIRIENPLGTVEISHAYFSNLVGAAVTSCYGVAGMIRSGARQGLRSAVFRRSFSDDGVRVRDENGKLAVDLHIAVIYGMNIAEITKSIVNKVRYAVEQATGLDVRKVNVYIDGMKDE